MPFAPELRHKRCASLTWRRSRLEQLVAAFRQAMFGCKSERLDPDQFELATEDMQTGIATIKAEEEACKLTPKPTAACPHVANRGFLPKHLPRAELVVEPEASVCGCGGGLHQIGKDVSERLDVNPAQFRVIRCPAAHVCMRERGHPASEVCLPILLKRCGASA